MPTCILYARVSTQEQAQSGYSLRQQLERLREYAETEGLTVLEEVQDPGQSGASLERPGLDRVCDLVSEGGVSVVLAQDRDRFAREPAYLFLLKEEFGERGTILRALNDRGDNSAEGELTDGILDQLAKFERAKTAERTRRGRVRKAKEGKVVGPQPHPPFGFLRDGENGYVVDPVAMGLVRRLFELVAEGPSLRSIMMLMDSEGVPTPRGARFWSENTIRGIVKHDAYKRRTFEEVRELVSPSVAAGLDPEAHYGVVYYGMRKTSTRQVAEDTPQGRVYRRKSKAVYRDRSEWVAIPITDPGIPRELVDEARARIANNKAPSRNAGRPWSLSAGVLVCGGCGYAMAPTRINNGSGRYYLYYLCSHRRRHGREACEQIKLYPAVALEDAVWSAVVELTADPHSMVERIDRLIASERRKLRGSADREAGAWLKRLEDLDGQRKRAQDMAVRGLLSFDELGDRLGELDKARDLARRELEVSRGRTAHVDSLVEIRAIFVRQAEAADRFAAETPPLQYAEMKPIWSIGPFAQRHRAEMAEKSPEERMDLYRELGITAEIDVDGGISLRGMVPMGTVCTDGTSSRRRS